MVEIYKTGKVPLIQIHDELALSVTDLEEARGSQKIMENCVELQVPCPTDAALGPNRGSLKDA